jgi:hypothetical protein
LLFIYLFILDRRHTKPNVEQEYFTMVTLDALTVNSITASFTIIHSALQIHSSQLPFMQNTQTTGL